MLSINPYVPYQVKPTSSPYPTLESFFFTRVGSNLRRAMNRWRNGDGHGVHEGRKITTKKKGWQMFGFCDTWLPLSHFGGECLKKGTFMADGRCTPFDWAMLLRIRVFPVGTTIELEPHILSSISPKRYLWCWKSDKIGPTVGCFLASPKMPRVRSFGAKATNDTWFHPLILLYHHVVQDITHPHLNWWPRNETNSSAQLPLIAIRPSEKCQASGGSSRWEVAKTWGKTCRGGGTVIQPCIQIHVSAILLYCWCCSIGTESTKCVCFHPKCKLGSLMPRKMREENRYHVLYIYIYIPKYIHITNIRVRYHQVDLNP